MPTTREVAAAKLSRLERERRHYTPAMLGRPCPDCKERVPLALVNAGEHYHPTCGKAARAVMREARLGLARTLENRKDAA